MRLIIGGQYYSTPDGSSMRIQSSMTDPVPTCSVNIVDNASAINIIAPQELLVIDEQFYPNPTINLLQNPTMNPDNTNWNIAGGFAGVTTAQNGGGGVIITTNNYSGGSRAMIMSQGPLINNFVANQYAVVPGQTYVFSVYGIASGPIGQTGASMIILWLDANGNSAGQTFFADGPIPAPTSLTRYSCTGTAPANAAFFTVEFGLVFSAPSNGGSITFTNAQMEPLWFPTLSYPTPFCGPSQTNCQQLPLGQWIRQYRKFAGFVTKVSPGDYHGNVRTIQVSAAGYAWLTGSMIGNDTFSSKTDKQVITTLVGKYLLSNGTAMTTTTNVIQGISVSSTQLNWDDVRTALDGLCGLSGFYWTIDAYWNVIYAPPGYFSMPIALICDSSSVPDMITTFPAYNFKADEDFTQPGSNIIVLGNGSNTAQVIDPSRVEQIGIICGYSLPTTTSWMRKINDSTLASVSDCTQRGMAELIIYDNTRGIYHLSTNVELLAGQGIRVTSNTDGLNQTTLLLQQVTASWLGTSETLTDVWQYDADLGAVNRAATKIISRIHRTTQRNTSAPAINTVTLAVLENVGVVDSIDGGTLYPEAVLADSPVAYYRLGEPDGFSITSAYDWGGTTQTGTYHGTFTLGEAGPLYNDSNTAVLFDGSTGYVLLPNGLISANHDLSLEMWVNVPSFAADGGGVQRRLFIDNIDNTNAFQMATQGVDSSFVWGVNDSTGQVISSHQNFNVNQWYHVVGTWIASSRTAQLYVNGVAQSNAGASSFGIGSIGTNIARRTDSTGYFPGTMDEVAIYNTVLSPQHILTHYIAGTTAALNPIYSTTILGLSPLAYYRLGEPSGTTASDSSGNARNGTISGTMTLGQPGAIALDFNSGMTFDGSTAYITLVSALNGNGLTACSFEGWFRLSTASLGAFTQLVQTDNTGGASHGFQIYWNGTTSLNWNVGNGTTNVLATYTVSPQAEIWWHIVGTYDGANIRLYTNGVLRATTAFTGTINASATPVLGATTGHGSPFPGTMDEVAFYNFALSAAQVTQHYNIGLTGHA